MTTPFAESRRAMAAAALAWLTLATPPARASLESTMTLHMLLQLPLLAVIGFVIGRQWLGVRGPAPRQLLAAVQAWNRGGVTGLLAAGFAMVLWMLPRCLDLARLDPAVDALKLVTLPAAGLAVALSWPRLSAIARGVVHLEAIATLLRFGWGYLAAEQRLCLAYLAGDQQQAGELLLWAAAVYAAAVVWRPLFGGRSTAHKRAPIQYS